VNAVEIEGSEGTQVVRRDGIRSALGALRSNMFTVEFLKENGGVPAQVIFFGAGWGHGVGLCQSGARGLAVDGKGYSAILFHYYPSASLRKIY
jgi:stage II sporulation protein D